MLNALKSLKSEVLRAVSDLTGSDSDKETKESEAAAGSDFETFLKGILSPNAENNISEEALFAGLVTERVQALKGEESAAKFSKLYESNKASMNGSCEDAAKAALRQLRTDGDVSEEEAGKIYSESFAAAQLDGNTSALFDDRGGTGDATVAVQTMEAALVAAQLKIDKYTNGEETAELRSLDEESNAKTTASAAVPLGSFDASELTGDTSGDPFSAADDTSGASFATELAMLSPNGSVIDGANGFLFKPISDNDGNLAVLLPEMMAHKVESVVIKDAAGNVIEEGRSTGYGELGTREKFSFSRPGGNYGQNLVVEVRSASGGMKQYSIPDPGQRYD